MDEDNRSMFKKVIWSIQLFFHNRRLRKMIPKGDYCYSWGYKCCVCPFFMWIEWEDELNDETVKEGGCSYLKQQGGMCLDDQCKECGLD